VPDGWKLNTKTFLAQYYPILMSDPASFCAVVAFAESMKHQALGERREPTDVTIKYQSKAVTALRERLLEAKPELKDTVILAIVNLICIDVSLRTCAIVSPTSPDSRH